MDFIQRLIRYFAVVRKKAMRHRRLVTTCAAVVVFVTAYALILPAITLDEDTASETPGVSVGQPATEETNNEATDASAAEEPATTAQDASATAAEGTAAELTAQTDDGTYEATVSYGADAGIPEGATLKVTPYAEDSSEYAAAKKAVVDAKKADDASFDEGSLGLVAVDVSIVDANGNKVEPAEGAKVAVKLTARDFLPEGISADAVEVQHIKDDAAANAADAVETVADATDATDGKVTVDDNASTATAEFDVDSFSTFTISYTYYGSTYSLNNIRVVDTDGNAIGNDSNYTMSGYYVSLDTVAQQANPGDGYTFVRASVGSYNSSSSVSSSDASAWYFTEPNTTWYLSTSYEYPSSTSQRYTLTNQNVYLVYQYTAPVSGLNITDTVMKDGNLNAYVDSTPAKDAEAEGHTYTYTWSRSDSQDGTYTDVTRRKVSGDMYNIGEDGTTLNVTLDGGAQKWYKVTRVDDNGTPNDTSDDITTTSDPVKADYYAELQNGSFEEPPNIGEGIQNSPDTNQSLITDGSAFGWKTTESEGTIEISHRETDDQKTWTYNAYNIPTTEDSVPDGYQFAELNSKSSGSLYQDVLTVPGSTMYWQLYHRARGSSSQKNSSEAQDTMYVVVMSADKANSLNITTQDQVNALINNFTFDSNGIGTTTNSDYAGVQVVKITDDNCAWYVHNGSYTVPEGQYLTRYFFVAGSCASGDTSVGNLLDKITFSTSVPEPSNDKANLVVQKVIDASSLSDDQVTALEAATDAGLKFTVSGLSSGSSTTVNGSDTAMSWAYNSGANTYTGTYTITDISVPANSELSGVTVAESNYGVSGFNATQSVTVRSTGSSDSSSKNGTSTDSFSIKGGTTTTVEFTNTYAPNTGSVSFTKKGQQAGSKETKNLSGATFGLYKNVNDSSAAYTANSDTNGTVSFSNIPVGTYYMKETVAPTGYEVSSTVYKVEITATGSSTASSIKPIDESGAESAAVTEITDSLHTESLKLKKTDGSDTALTGAKFTLQVKDPNGNWANVSATGVTNGVVDMTSVSELTLGDLPYGSYKLTETSAPDGYVVLGGDIEFEVTGAGVQFATGKDYSGKAELTTYSKDGVQTLTVKNEAGKALPQTGGSGATPFAIAGSALIITAILGFALRRRNEGRGV